MKLTFDSIIELAQRGKRMKLAVASAQDSHVLAAVETAHKIGIADAILVGNRVKIEKLAVENGISLDGLEIINEEEGEKSALKAVEMVHFGEADMYMKGLMETKAFLKTVLDKNVGLRTDRLMSHIAVFDIPGYDRLLSMSDVAFIPYPTLDEKRQIIDNCVGVAKACGVAMPKVAVLSSIETVNPKMPCTIEAAELARMNEEGIIKDCIVDGPLSFDLATAPEAALHKNASGRKIVGDADILIFPDIQAGNITYKCMSHMVNHRSGCILTGTKAPTILTSRSDDMETKVNSIALAAVVAQQNNNNK
ncbi:MAG: bifunctional enoyl-CoA hydratase/phosphate acetyltransferase [Bacteroidales bacterium]|nr:bifunctional enoyl-CoA hydratase/phosphate acetyltransferase [Bacteroidales bacterium]